MSEPVIADTQPMVMELEVGDYFWCTCGRSAGQPFCDGSHQGTGFTPMKLTLETQRQVALCACKHTGNPPFCDGSHTTL
ncbi:MAG TPA: CDGSH iron-sulfur domain-containing protein [Leptolyngbyaceae cyanobacterium M65_K2018_010]|nr:CDGSH iron-sulfur domain-containing protein [Leptolyngbyaceae cyanobacterium M65_K2018_010]